MSPTEIRLRCGSPKSLSRMMATASVTGEVLRTPNAKMKEQLGKGGPKLFTPWVALQDQALAQED